MADQPLRELLINSSMTKPILMMGCERNLFAASALGCGYLGFNLGFAQGRFLVFFSAVAAWMAISFGLRLMGKADPYMSAVFKRATMYSSKAFTIQYKIPARTALGTRCNMTARKRWDV
jgi:type IV secretory pathway TrbD component